MAVVRSGDSISMWTSARHSTAPESPAGPASATFATRSRTCFGPSGGVGKNSVRGHSTGRVRSNRFAHLSKNSVRNSAKNSRSVSFSNWS